MDPQLKKGLLEICVLSAMVGEDSYGYKLVKDVSPVIAISESTLYPILKRLEGSGCVNVYSVEHKGRLRKYYRLTATGKRRIKDFCDNWDKVIKVYEFIERSYEDEKK